MAAQLPHRRENAVKVCGEMRPASNSVRREIYPIQQRLSRFPGIEDYFGITTRVCRSLACSIFHCRLRRQRQQQRPKPVAWSRQHQHLTAVSYSRGGRHPAVLRFGFRDEQHRRAVVGGWHRRRQQRRRQRQRSGTVHRSRCCRHASCDCHQCGRSQQERERCCHRHRSIFSSADQSQLGACCRRN